MTTASPSNSARVLYQTASWVVYPPLRYCRSDRENSFTASGLCLTSPVLPLLGDMIARQLSNARTCTLNSFSLIDIYEVTKLMTVGVCEKRHYECVPSTLNG